MRLEIRNFASRNFGPIMTENLKELLDAEAARINSPVFIADDPVQFPRRFASLPDVEIAALLAATIAWGNRKMICRNCDRMLALMADDPAQFVKERAYEAIDDDMNIHRTFFGRNFKHWCRALNRILTRHGSVQGLAQSLGIAAGEAPAWDLARGLLKEMERANDGRADSRCLPVNIDTSALKRLNMALRWLVRNDGIVDLGVWDVIKPSQLFIPLDVHVSDVSRQLGMLTRKSNDFKAVAELTDTCRAMRPSDPAIYDFALFGIGMRL